MEPTPWTGRVLMVADTLKGGLGEAVRGGARWLGESGWDVSVTGPGPSPDLHGAAFDEVGIPASLRDVRGARAAARAVRDAVRRIEPDVIHCHGVRSFVITRVLGRLQAALTLHGTGPSVTDPFGYQLLRRAGVGAAARLATASFSAVPEVGKAWVFAPHASPKLGELDRLPRPRATVPTFVWLGRLDHPKLPSLFVEALSRVASRTSVQGIVLGDGPLRGSLTRQAEALGAPVQWMGHVGDPVPFLEEAWGVALFSRFEAVPFAVQEAMWSGRAVVVSELPGTRWLVGDGGVLVTGVEQAAAALGALCERDRAVATGEAAAATARRRLTPNAPWPMVEATYREVHDASASR